MAAAGGRLAGFWSRILGPGCDGGPAVGPGGRGSTGPGGPFFLAGTGFSWSDWVRYRLDALPGGDDLVGPGPGGGDLEGPAASAADEAGGGVQEAVAQRLRLCFRQVALQGQQLQPGQQDAGGHRGVEPGLVDLVVVRGEMSQPGALPGADDVLDAGVDGGGAAGGGRSRRAKTRIPFGQAFSWSPSGPSRSSPVSSVTCASSIQQAGCAQCGFRQASSARRSRTWPRPSMAASQAVP